MVDIATRVWSHKWKIDPIVRSLIDTDFYKLLMCQSVFRNKPNTQVTFSLINRSSEIRLADLVDEGELREQLDHIRSLSLARRKYLDARQYILRKTSNVYVRIYGLV
jgi:nicotinate phosphoribosyltransferase